MSSWEEEDYYVCVCVCVCVYTNIYIHMYTDTHRFDLLFVLVFIRLCFLDFSLQGTYVNIQGTQTQTPVSSRCAALDGWDEEIEVWSGRGLEREGGARLTEGGGTGSRR